MSDYEKHLDAVDLVHAEHVLHELSAAALKAAETMIPTIDFSDVESDTWRVIAVAVLRKFSELTD